MRAGYDPLCRIHTNQIINGCGVIMRHKKLSRTSNQRKRLFQSLLKAFIYHGKITTTLAKAQVTKRMVEKLVTDAKKGTLVKRREIIGILSDYTLTTKLIEEIAPLFKNINGGYVRMVKLAGRSGDNASQVLLTWSIELPVKEIEKQKIGKQEKEKKK